MKNKNHQKFLERLSSRIILNAMLVFVLGFCIVTIACIMIVNSDVANWDKIPFSALGTLAAACIVALGGLAAAETYREKVDSQMLQRRWEVELNLKTRREQEYVTLANNFIAQFRGGCVDDITQSRVSVGLWGSPGVVEAMADWNNLVDSIPLSGKNGTERKVPADLTGVVEAKTSKIIIEMRKNLNGEQVSDIAMQKMLFNDSKS